MVTITIDNHIDTTIASFSLAADCRIICQDFCTMRFYTLAPCLSQIKLCGKHEDNTSDSAGPKIKVSFLGMAFCLGK